MIRFKFKIDEKRKMKKMTQQELSKLTGISQSNISRHCLNSPESEPSLSTLAKYAEVLACSVKDLFEETSTTE